MNDDLDAKSADGPLAPNGPSDETYEGWKNRETWAFWLWVTNDQGWYDAVRRHTLDEMGAKWSEAAGTWTVRAGSDSGITDYELGESVVGYVKEALDESVGHGDYTPDGSDRMMRDEIGSWWRIDYAEIGAAARELASDS